MIKSTTRDQVEEKEEELPYPVLMLHTKRHFIVLFYSRNAGVIVHGSPGHVVGHNSVRWWSAEDESVWRKYEGVVEISNKSL